MVSPVRFKWIANSGLICLLVGCTRLDNPNDRFGSAGGPTNDAGSSSGNGTGGFIAIAPDSGSNCMKDAGPSGLGCYACTPYDITTLEGACTRATCSPFDNGTRLTYLLPNGDLPALPVASGVAGASSISSAVPTGGSSNTATGGSSNGTAGISAGGAANSGGGSGTSNTASTIDACDALGARGEVVYVTGSSAAKPFLQQIAQQLSATGVFIVYTSTGSCVGVDAILNGTPMTTGAAPAPATTATYWDSSSSVGTACLLPSAGVTADLGISDVFAQTCPGFELSSLESHQVREAHGPIQTMTFTAPANSRFSEISAQAAYFVFGFGAAGGVRDSAGSSIWDDESYIFQRSASSGTQAMIAAAIGVPSSVWRGKPHKSSDDVAADLQSAATAQDTADKAIGILAADYIDSKNLRAQIRVLAYQDTNQACAFYPDSTVASRDKRNVRDGHYPIWSPLHVLFKTDSSGNPLNASTRSEILEIVGYLSGTKSLPNGVKLMDVYAQSGLVPECAMRVSRQKDGGNIQPFTPSTPCSCLFDFNVTGTTTCTSCTVQGDCGANETCSLGYCEK